MEINISPSFSKAYRYASQLSQAHESIEANFILIRDNYKPNSFYLILSKNSFLYHLRKEELNNYLFNFEILNRLDNLSFLKVESSISNSFSLENLLIKSLVLNSREEEELTYLSGSFSKEQELKVEIYDTPENLALFTYKADCN